MPARHGTGLYVISDPQDPKLAGFGEIYGDNGQIPGSIAEFRSDGSIVVIDADSDLNWFQANTAESDKPNRAVGVPVYEYIWQFGKAQEEDMPDSAGLIALGEAMVWPSSRIDTSKIEAKSNIPAAYTYLGQFIAHELTRLLEIKQENGPLSIGSPVFDLDSLYRTASLEQKTGLLSLGCTDGNRAEDIERLDHGEPAISDSRNDDNLPLAQTHVAFTKFHNQVARTLLSKSGKLDIQKIKRTVIQHFHSIILHDYLNRIIEPDTHADVLENGRRIIYPKGSYPENPQSKNFKLPIEFAAACFRFGHSMVRESYQHWNGKNNGGLDVFWAHTYNSSQSPKPKKLDDNWVNQWKRILSFKGTLWASHQDLKTVLMSSPINTQLAFGLGQIRAEALPTAVTTSAKLSNNLATRTLTRGHLLRLKSAQDVIRQINEGLGKDFPPIRLLADWELMSNESAVIKQAFEHRYPFGGSLKTCTPLWFYTLKEAQELGDGGNHLGPLGSRIVMETIHAAIQFSEHSILNSDEKIDWKPNAALRPTDASKYTFPDMIMFIEQPASNTQK